jgi:hypothetical protein
VHSQDIAAAPLQHIRADVTADVVAAWKTRQRRVAKATVRWIEKRFYAKGSFHSPAAGSNDKEILLTAVESGGGGRPKMAALG